MRFQALEVSIAVIRALRDPVARLEQRDRELARQIRTAASSIPADLAGGRRRAAKDRRHHWRIAAGSADEVVNNLRVAIAWGFSRNARSRRPCGGWRGCSPGPGV